MKSSAPVVKSWGREGCITAYGVRYCSFVHAEQPKWYQRDLYGLSRTHRPMTIEKAVDKTTPRLLQAMNSREQLTGVVIKWYRINRYGHEGHSFTYTLNNAIITDYRLFREREFFSFAFEEIIWRYEPESIETSDRWQVLTNEKGYPLFALGMLPEKRSSTPKLIWNISITTRSLLKMRPIQ